MRWSGWNSCVTAGLLWDFKTLSIPIVPVSLPHTCGLRRELAAAVPASLWSCSLLWRSGTLSESDHWRNAHCNEHMLFKFLHNFHRNYWEKRDSQQPSKVMRLTHAFKAYDLLSELKTTYVIDIVQPQIKSSLTCLGASCLHSRTLRLSHLPMNPGGVHFYLPCKNMWKLWELRKHSSQPYSGMYGKIVLQWNIKPDFTKSA